MTWTEALSSVMDRHGQDHRHLPPGETAAVARQFVEEELLPHLEQVAVETREVGLSAYIKVGEELRRGPRRNLERAGMAVSRHSRGGEPTVPVAELEFEYRGNLDFEALHHTKRGRRNSTVFSLAGEPLVHVQSVVESFREDVGLNG